MENPSSPVYTSLVPMLPVTDVARAIVFYEQLGLTVGNTFTPDGASEPVWAWLYSGRAHLMVNRAEDAVLANHHSAALWLYSEDVKGAHAQLAARGLDVGEIGYPPYNPGGEFHVHDPDGYAVFVAHAE